MWRMPLLTDPTTMVVTVRNPGPRRTRSVVFAHAGVRASEWDRPQRRLVGFARADVDAGAVVEIEIELDWSMLDVRVDGDWVTERGEYVIDVGRYAGDPEAIAVVVHR